MDRKRKRHSDLENFTWTAARCQRLLRPIASRVLPLRRLSYITDSQSNPEDLISASNTNPGTTKSGDKNNTTLDPAWFPGQERKSQLKKYSSRSRFSQSEKSSTKHASGQQENESLISLPTPFKARALRRGTPIKQQHVNHELADSPSIGRKQPLVKSKRTKRDPFARAPLAKQSAELQNRQNYERIFELHQGVSDGFSLLLQRTAPTNEDSSIQKGVPSLLKMCLRKIPDYIQAEEEWRKSIDEDDETDVSAEVYEELENLGVSPRHGWPNLRDVVMAHGVKLIRDIIQDKLVARNTRAELANMPLRHGLSREAEELSLAYAHSLPLKRPLKADSPLFDGCLVGLQDIGFNLTESVRNGMHIRILDNLFHSGRLRLSWLASRDMVKFSSEMIRALALKSGKNADIIHFLHGRIMQATQAELHESVECESLLPSDPSTRFEKSVNSTIISIITVLTAIVLLGHDSQDLHQAQQPTTLAKSLLNGIAINILRELQQRTVRKKSSLRIESCGQSSSVCFAVLASTLILSINQPTVGNNKLSLVKEEILQGMSQIHENDPTTMNGISTMIERAALFICDLARCCGQSLNSSSQEYLEFLVQRFMRHAQDGSSLEKTLLQQLALESSLYFAKISATQKSRLFMETIENSMLRQEPLQLQSPAFKGECLSSPVKRKGLRWEEGLCEWIAATPLATAKVRNRARKSSARVDQTVAEESDIHDSGYISALQETPARRRKSAMTTQIMTSPDVLGMESEFYSRFDNRAQAQAIESEPPRMALTFQPMHLDKENHDIQGEVLSSIAKPQKFQSCPIIVADETKHLLASLPATGSPSRSKKRRKAGPVKHQKPDKPKSQRTSLSSAIITSQHPKSSHSGYPEKTRVIEKVEDEEDELAMSCKKKPRQPTQHFHSLKRGLSLSKRSETSSALSLRTKRVNQVVSDASEDELGD